MSDDAGNVPLPPRTRNSMPPPGLAKIAYPGKNRSSELRERIARYLPWISDEPGEQFRIPGDYSQGCVTDLNKAFPGFHFQSTQADRDKADTKVSLWCTYVGTARR